jgi:hypothetical protein
MLQALNVLSSVPRSCLREHYKIERYFTGCSPELSGEATPGKGENQKAQYSKLVLYPQHKPHLQL